jgi:hypothetical protein
MSSISGLPNITSLFSPLSTSGGSSSTSIATLPSLQSSTLLSFFGAKTIVAATAVAQHSATAWSAKSTTSTANTPPWQQQQTTNPQALEAQVLSTTDFIKQSTTPLVGTSSSSKETQQDNQNLFTLYQALSSLGTLAGIAKQPGVTAGQLAGYNTRFQAGLAQVKSFIGSTSFNNFTLQTQNPSASVSGTAGIPLPAFNVTGKTLVSDANLQDALPGVSASDSFTVGLTKGGTTTNVEIDLSQIQGTLSLGNIVNYTNAQLKAAGFTTRLQPTITSGSINDAQNASWGIALTPGAGEAVNLSSSQATPSLFLTGTSGSTTGSPANTTTGERATSPSNQGNIAIIGNLSGTPQSLGNATVSPTTGNTTVQSSVVDSQGNLYVVGNATGNFGNELNQASQDVYLSKYNSAGQVVWSQLLGSTGTSAAYSLALNPNGGVVVAGSSTAPITTTSIDDGNTDSFVASYDGNGNQNWVQQIPTLTNNQANAVSVDSQGNVYVGGSVTGVLGAGQTSSGGTNAYLAKLDSNGKIVAENQFGPSGTDSVAATAVTSGGDVIVASQQNGQAILSSYAGGDVTAAPTWQMSLGDLNGGSISGIAVSGNQIYVSGTTSNAALDAGGQATIATPSTGGTQAFVFSATDAGSSGTANSVSYVGTTTGTTKGGGLTVGPDGTVYLAGTTTGTFAGQVRSVAGANNAFVAALSSNGTINWTNQYGGTDGQSTGTSVAVDPTGSSVLNALGLPNGPVSINQSVALSSNTTLRAGDSFKLRIEGTGGRTATITVGQGDTLQSLVDQINSELLSNGKASITYTAKGQTLEIKANPGATISVNAGPAASDALGRLGITPGVITAPAKKGSTASASTTSTGTSSTAAKPVYGLQLNTQIDLSTSGDAGVAKIVLQSVLNTIQNIYQKTNTPAGSSTTGSTSSQSGGSAPSYLKSQVANYNLALSVLGGSSSSGSTVA